MDPKDAGTHALLADASALLLQVCLHCPTCCCCAPQISALSLHLLQVSSTCGPELVHFVQASAAPTLGIQEQSPVRPLQAWMHNCVTLSWQV